MRLVLTQGVPGPWGELAKGIFHVKGIPFAPVSQEGGGENPALQDWTGQAGAPVAVWNEEPPRSGRHEILFLAERLAPEPALLPRDPSQRAWCLGVANEIAGELGFGWCRRLRMVHALMQAPSLPGHLLELRDRLGWRYGYSPEAAAMASERAAQVLRSLASRLHAQHERGSAYLLGDSLTVADITWACFAAMIRPLPPELCPMAEATRATYQMPDPTLEAALDPILIAHRDFIYREHLVLPLDF